MPRFYFHKHLNGQTVPDRRGTSLRNINEACARAVRCTPSALRKSVRVLWEDVMADALHIVCLPHCDASNREPRERLRDGAKCGSCHRATAVIPRVPPEE
jgi:hypothetical protein